MFNPNEDNTYISPDPGILELGGIEITLSGNCPTSSFQIVDI